MGTRELILVTRDSWTRESTRESTSYAATLVLCDIKGRAHENRLSDRDICASTVRLKNFLRNLAQKSRSINPDFQTGRVLEILKFWPVLASFLFCTRIVVRVQKNWTKNRGVVSNPDFCARYLKQLSTRKSIFMGSTLNKIIFLLTLNLFTFENLILFIVKIKWLTDKEARLF